MNTVSDTDLQAAAPTKAAPGGFDYSGQVVLVLQGGGALGAYQVGVYQALRHQRRHHRRQRCR
jgi:predicted acylesterase/phospholipase RssA